MNGIADFLYSLSTPLMGFLIVSVFVATALLGLLLVRRRIYGRCRISDATDDAVGGLFSGISILFGILLGLVAVSTWNNFDEVERLVSQEVGAIRAFHQNLEALQEPARNQLKADTQAYIKAIVDVEWPSYQKGEIPIDGSSPLDRLFQVLSGYQPSTLNEHVIFMQSMAAFNRMQELRQVRVDAVTDEAIPEVFWAVMLISAGFSIFTTYFFHLPSFFAHLTLVGVFSALIGCVFFLVVAIDHPFRGGVRVFPDKYRAILASIHTPHAVP